MRKWSLVTKLRLKLKNLVNPKETETFLYAICLCPMLVWELDRLSSATRTCGQQVLLKGGLYNRSDDQGADSSLSLRN